MCRGHRVKPSPQPDVSGLFTLQGTRESRGSGGLSCGRKQGRPLVRNGRDKSCRHKVIKWAPEASENCAHGEQNHTLVKEGEVSPVMFNG